MNTKTIAILSVLIVALFTRCDQNDKEVDKGDEEVCHLVFDFSDPNSLRAMDTVTLTEYIFENGNVNRIKTIRVANSKGQLIQDHDFYDDFTAVSYYELGYNEILFEKIYEHRRDVEVHKKVESNLDSIMLIAFFTMKDRDTINYFLPNIKNGRFTLKTDYKEFQPNSAFVDSLLIEYTESLDKLKYEKPTGLGYYIPMVEDAGRKSVSNSLTFSTNAEEIIGRISGELNVMKGDPFSYHYLHVKGDLISRIDKTLKTRRKFYQYTLDNNYLKKQILCSGEYTLKDNKFVRKK